MENKQHDRFGSFFERVQTERAVLRLVNNAFPKEKLHGITQPAIASWRTRSLTSSTNLSEQVEDILLSISARIDSLADQSHFVFTGEAFNASATTELIKELEVLCCDPTCKIE
jgi:hypothetical protein